jgi:hypothetical protein
MRPPETAAPPRVRGHQDDTDQAHPNATAPTTQAARRLDVLGWALLDVVLWVAAALLWRAVLR